MGQIEENPRQLIVLPNQVLEEHNLMDKDQQLTGKGQSIHPFILWKVCWKRLIICAKLEIMHTTLNSGPSALPYGSPFMNLIMPLL
uniref:Uncharacterized protein n=1 Tax=Oryza rufipogon TaxID=4529 RepID=A0A0E0R7X4_ORYRU